MTDRSQDFALLLGRILIAALFLPSGLGKLMTFGAFTASLDSRGVPLAPALGAIGVAIEVLGPLALLTGVLPKPTALVMAAFVIMATLISHRFWEYADAARKAQASNFWKNAGILGGLMFYYASGPGAFSLASLTENRPMAGALRR